MISGLKALILVGGYGTRLRPLTLSHPKPIVPFCNKPIVIHQIEALVRAGVTTVIFAISYQHNEMAKALEPYEAKLGVKIQYSQEQEPLGTAGPIALAKSFLTHDENPTAPFFVLNSDIISEFPFVDMLEFHYKHKKEGTILVTPVSDPSKYGVVIYEQCDGRIHNFIEKPVQHVGNKINAGMYIFNTSILSRIPLCPTSIEKDIFPIMAQSGELYALELQGFWMDIGQPKDYLAGVMKYLMHRKRKATFNEDERGYVIVEPVKIDKSSTIGIGCMIGPYVAIGPNCVIEDGVRIIRSTVMENTKIKAHAWINLSIIGWRCTIGRWARLDNVTVLGMDVNIADEVFINGAKVLPHKNIEESVSVADTIIM